MTWLARIAAGAGAKLAMLAALAGAVLFAIARIFRAGGDAARAKSAQAAHDHQTKTATEVSKSDEAVADPLSDRARRVRGQFQRHD